MTAQLDNDISSKGDSQTCYLFSADNGTYLGRPFFRHKRMFFGDGHPGLATSASLSNSFMLEIAYTSEARGQ